MEPDIAQVLPPTTFQKKLNAWYTIHQRPLPWRQNPSPYTTWLSEIILQQTRVAQGQSYYARILEAFPTLQDLAAASQEEVLSLWQGLGYYTRARNMHGCAQQIVAHHDGKFPTTYETLRTLPGIGPYTAGAIASIAFEERIPVVDGNVYRFLARLFGISDDLTRSSTQKKFHHLATQLLPHKEIGTHNQAMMEFGALVCTPQQPKCTTCPFQSACIAYRTHAQKRLPVKTPRTKIKRRFFHYLVLSTPQGVYMQQRKAKDIWQELYQFYLIETNTKKNLHALQEDPLLQAIKRVHPSIPHSTLHHTHRLTHQELQLFFFHIKVNASLEATLPQQEKRHNLHLFTWQELAHLPLPIAIRRAYDYLFKKPKLL